MMPKRKVAAKREPNGRKSRRASSVQVEIDNRKVSWTREDQDMVSVAIEARQRVFGLSAKDARSQNASTFYGRLFLKGEITESQCMALDRYKADKAAYSGTVGGPKPDSAQDPNRMPGRSNYENSKRDRAIAEHDRELRELITKEQLQAMHRAAERAVQDAQYALRNRSNLWGALYEIVEKDREIYNLVGDLKEAANALVRHYGIEARAAA